jgi:hypothetical protein
MSVYDVRPGDLPPQQTYEAGPVERVGQTGPFLHRVPSPGPAHYKPTRWGLIRPRVSRQASRDLLDVMAAADQLPAHSVHQSLDAADVRQRIVSDEKDPQGGYSGRVDSSAELARSEFGPEMGSLERSVDPVSIPELIHRLTRPGPESVIVHRDEPSG